MLTISSLISLRQFEFDLDNHYECLVLVFIKADTHEGFCSRSMLEGHFARVSTHEGAFSSSLNLPRELAPKYLTG